MAPGCPMRAPSQGTRQLGSRSRRGVLGPDGRWWLWLSTQRPSRARRGCGGIESRQLRSFVTLTHDGHWAGSGSSPPASPASPSTVCPWTDRDPDQPTVIMTRAERAAQAPCSMCGGPGDRPQNPRIKRGPVHLCTAVDLRFLWQPVAHDRHQRHPRAPFRTTICTTCLKPSGTPESGSELRDQLERGDVPRPHDREVTPVDVGDAGDPRGSPPSLVIKWLRRW
jgi:hypothetical protein